MKGASLADLRQDLRQTARSLARDRSFTIVAIVLLGIGMAANATIFSVLDAVLLRPLPYADPDAIVHVGEVTPDGRDFTVSQANYLDFRAQQRTLLELGAFRDQSVVYTGGTRPERLRGAAATASFFDVLGVAPRHGRTFSREEDAPGAQARVAVISEPLWRRTFGADPGVVGTSVLLNGEAHTIIGVMPATFAMRSEALPSDTDVWLPLGASPHTDRTDHWLDLVGRLRPGETPAAATRDLEAISARIAEVHPEIRGWGARVRPLREVVTGESAGRGVWVLMFAVGLLLLLACANVANLFLARATARSGELALRAALGAGRRHLLRQLLLESVLLASAGAALALLMAVWLIDGAEAVAGSHLPGIEQAALDARVVLFVIVLSLLVTVLCGLLPALRAGGIDLHTLIKGTTRANAARGARRTRELLVVVQVAIAMLLLLGAGLLLRSYLQLRGVDPGFTIDHVYAVPLEVTEAAYDEYWQVSVFYRSVAERIAALPGVAAAGATTTEPFRSFRFVNDVTPVERAAEVGPAGYVQADWRSVTRGYFDAAQIPLLHGRLFRATDTHEAPRVAVINAALAERLWPGGDAVGRSFYWGGTEGEPIEVIGVVGNVRDFALDQEPPPMLFLSAHQLVMPNMTLLVRTRGSVAGLREQIRNTVWTLNPDVAVPVVQSVGEYRDDALRGPRTRMALLLCFGVLALFVAAIGVYALVSYQVAMRRRELAIRHALGAQPRSLRRLVIGRSAVLILSGVMIGVAGALAIGRLVRTLLYETAPTDPLSFITVPAVLVIVALGASYLPARRSAGVDPLDVLRSE